MSEIPAIQFLWIGSQLSRMERLSLVSFVKHGYTVHLYSYGPIENIPEGVLTKDANTVISEDRIFKYKDFDSYAAFANLFRYKLLFDKGGVWSDIDMICLKPLDISQDYLFASERMETGSIRINNCFIKAPAGSDIMAYCYEMAKAKDPNKLIWGETGPQLLTKAISQYRLGKFVVFPEVFCPVDWWNADFFISKSLAQIKTENTSYIHLYHEAWRWKSIDKRIRFTTDCAYEELFHLYEIT